MRGAQYPGVTREVTGRGELTTQKVPSHSLNRRCKTMALTWTEKLTLLTQKGLTWKEVQEMDKGLDSEKEPPKEEPPKEEPPKEEPPKEEPPKEEPPKEEPPKEPDEKDLKIAELEAKLKEAQSDNVHANNGGTQELTFEEQLDTMFKDYKF